MPGATACPTGWRGDELRTEPGRYRRSFSAAELDDLLARAARTDLTRPEPRFPTGPGPVADLAASVRSDLLQGLGFTMVYGFPIDSVPYEETATAFVILSAMVGSLRPQNAAGHRLGHVIDVGADADDPTVRIYQTNQRQTFHTDGADGVGLLCVRRSREGGASMLVSVAAVVDEMDRRSPGRSNRLFEPVATDRRGEQAVGERPFFSIPVLTRVEAGPLTVSYQRQYIESARRFPDAPVLDDDYIGALDLFDEVMNDPDVHLRIDLEPGDVQFVHNHSLLHDRTGFVDHAEPDRRRHLLRVWLALPGDRSLHPAFEERYGSSAIGDRGGVLAGLAEPTFPLYPDSPA